MSCDRLPFRIDVNGRGGARIRPSQSTHQRWSSIFLLFPVVAGAGCSGSAPLDDGAIEIAEAAYERQRMDILQPAPFRCGDEASSLLCDRSSIDAVVLAGPNLYTFSEGQVRLSVSGGEPRLLARDGSGPGELRAPIAFGSDRNGRLLAFDIARMRLVSIGTDKSADERAVFPPPNFRFPRIRAGALYALTQSPGEALGEPADAAILRFSFATETWSDTVARFSEPAASVRASADRVLMRLPWDRSVLWDACDDGRVVLAHSDQWLIEWYGDTAKSNAAPSSNAPSRVLRPKAPREPMTSEEHNGLVAEHVARLPVAMRSSPDPRLSVRPQHRRVLDAVYCGTNSTAVVVNAPNFGDSLRTIDMVRDNGTLLRSVRIPSSFRILDVHEDKVFGFMFADDLSERFAYIAIRQ